MRSFAKLMKNFEKETKDNVKAVKRSLSDLISEYGFC